MPKSVAAEVARSLRERIEAGEWSDTRRLPNERDLAAEYQRRAQHRAQRDRPDRRRRFGDPRGRARHVPAPRPARRFHGDHPEALGRQPDRHDGGAADFRAARGGARGDQRQRRRSRRDRRRIRRFRRGGRDRAVRALGRRIASADFRRLAQRAPQPPPRESCASSAARSCGSRSSAAPSAPSAGSSIAASTRELSKR